MSVINYLIETIVSLGTVIVLFFTINRISYSFRSILLVILLRVLFASAIVTLNELFSNQFLTYLNEPLFGLLLAVVFLRPLPKTLLFFYGLFPFVLDNLFYRIFTYFILPLFGQAPGIIKDTPTYVVANLLSLLGVFLFLKWLRYDFVKFRTESLAYEDKRVLNLANWAMVVYYLLIQTLTYLHGEKGITSMPFRQLIVVIYLVIFMGIIKQLDLHLRQKLEEKLHFQQSMQLRDLENYSTHIEELYQEVRSFRHDYANLLTTLRLGIEDKDIDQISAIYQSVLKDSQKKLRTSKYDIARLINVDQSALKSLLASKFIQANDNHIAVSLEVPEVISPQGMDLVDFITIVSILLDNAIEATVEAEQPKLTIAFIRVNDKQLFIIENTTREESVDLSELYSLGYSSKGANRGIGLSNVMKIIERYPNASLNTTSQPNLFCQTLEISLVHESQTASK